jgi:iron complex transport system substrate-binding protein
LNTIDSWLVETVVNARNAFRTKGAWNILGTEQILAIDPDVIVLITAWGYHPPRELYEAPYYQNLKDLRAVKNRRVTALPWTPCNCDKRVEYPIDIMIMAKAAYPERFADVDLNVWLLDFYQNVYGVDKKTAAQLRAVQWMDWITEK